MAQHQWRRKVVPSCLQNAQEAVAQLRSRGIRADLEGGTWIVFDLWVKEGASPDAVVAHTLDQVWPAWRDCVTS
jgi:hypothetical protein